MQTKILVYGNDPILLLPRRLILEKTGFRVFTTLEFSDAMQLVMNQEIALLILCQSLKVDERQGVMATVGAVQPTVKTLIMKDDQPAPLLKPHEEVLDSLAGPAVFLATLNRMLANSV